MTPVIGPAEDFYRLRVVRVDVSGEPDLEWRDDILYRDPPPDEVEEAEAFRVEAVRIDDEAALPIADYESSDAAHAALDGLSEDLAALTKSQFEQRYLSD